MRWSPFILLNIAYGSASMSSSENRMPIINLIFLHGALQSKEVFYPLMRHIQESEPDWLGKMIAIDLPGHGSARNHRSRYQPDVLADYVLNKIPSSVLEVPTIVVAQSFSGITATVLPEQAKNIVGVVMLDTPLRVSATITSMALLINTYKKQRDEYEWIPRLLTDFFHCLPDRLEARSRDYYEYIVNATVPLVMVTGEIKLVRAFCRRERTTTDHRGVEATETVERVIVGSHDEVLSYSKEHGWKILKVSAGACFTDADLNALKERHVDNLKIYSLPDTGHNVLVERNIKLVAELVSTFAMECLSAWVDRSAVSSSDKDDEPQAQPLPHP